MGLSSPPINCALYLVFLCVQCHTLQYLSLISIYSDTLVLFDSSTLVYHAISLLQIHPFLCVECFNNRPDPTEEP